MCSSVHSWRLEVDTGAAILHKATGVPQNVNSITVCTATPPSPTLYRFPVPLLPISRQIPLTSSHFFSVSSLLSVR